MLDVAPASLRRLFELKVLTGLGLISYSLYLWQQPFFMLSEGNMPVLLAVLLALAGGILSYRNVEQPARHALNAWRQSRRGESAASAPSATG